MGTGEDRSMNVEQTIARILGMQAEAEERAHEQSHGRMP